MPNKPITAERIAGIKADLDRGMTRAYISKKYKVGSTTITLVEQDNIQPGDCHPKSSVPDKLREQIDYVCLRYGAESRKLWKEWDTLHARYGSRRAIHG